MTRRKGFEKIVRGGGREGTLSRYSVRSCLRDGVRLVREGGETVPYDLLKTSREGASAFAGCFDGLDHEELWVLCMGHDFRGRSLVRVGEGTEGEVVVDRPALLRAVLLSGQPLFLVAHNHPCGDPTPSLNDWVATESLCEGAAAIGVECVDHIIVGGDRYASLRMMHPRLFEQYGLVEEGRP